MKWQDMRKSDNVEDVRGGGGGRRAPRGAMAGGIGLGGILLALIGSLIFGLNPADILSTVSSGDSTTIDNSPAQSAPINDEDNQFVSKILGDTEDVWGALFQKQLGQQYQPPKLVLFSGATQSACGAAQQQMGPFYCPNDQKVYLDMGFFSAIRATAGDHAEFARAYAIAHEVGHHIQNLTGIMDKVQAQRQQVDEATSNGLSVRLELQADCFAGVWGHYSASRKLIDRQDLEAALNTAAQIGDDYLQKQSRGRTSPETWTHGSSQQRMKWFTAGLKDGDMNKCDTFSTPNP